MEHQELIQETSYYLLDYYRNMTPRKSVVDLASKLDIVLLNDPNARKNVSFMTAHHASSFLASVCGEPEQFSLERDLARSDFLKQARTIDSIIPQSAIFHWQGVVNGDRKLTLQMTL